MSVAAFPGSEPHPNAPANDALPSNIEAEQALLGCMLYDNEVLDKVDDLEGRHFFEPFHGRLWDAMRQRVGRGVVAEPIGMAEHLRPDTAFAELGGVEYLIDLVTNAPPAFNAVSYADVIRSLAARRELLKLSELIAGGALDRSAEPDEVIQAASAGLSDLETGSVGDHWQDAGAAVREAVQYAQTRSGRIDYPTGVPSLDRFIGGLNAGEMTLLAARPGMGKTVAALSIARANAEIGLGVCFFSLEMTRSSLAMRLACDLAYDRSAPVFSGVPTSPTFDRAMKGELEEAQWRQIAAATSRMDEIALKIDDRSGLTMQQIEAATRRQHRLWRQVGIQPGPVVIDHLGKVRPPMDRRGSKHAEVADVSNAAQVMAKRLGVPVLALVQLNRGVEGRDDKRPQLSDLRQAGELEEDARQVLFLYRPEYYVREAKPDENFEERTERMEKLQACRNQLFWLVEKNSHGARGQVQSFCEIACSAVREW